MIGIRGLVPLLLMLMSSSVLKVLLSIGTVLSKSNGLYLGTGLSFGLFLGKLRTHDHLSFLFIDTIYVLCNREDESHDHLFFSCDWSCLLWSRFKQWLRLNRFMSSFSSAIRGLSGRSKKLHNKMRRVSLAFLVHLI